MDWGLPLSERPLTTSTKHKAELLMNIENKDLLNLCNSITADFNKDLNSCMEFLDRCLFIQVYLNSPTRYGDLLINFAHAVRKSPLTSKYDNIIFMIGKKYETHDTYDTDKLNVHYQNAQLLQMFEIKLSELVNNSKTLNDTDSIIYFNQLLQWYQNAIDKLKKQLDSGVPCKNIYMSQKSAFKRTLPNFDLCGDIGMLNVVPNIQGVHVIRLFTSDSDYAALAKIGNLFKICSGDNTIIEAFNEGAIPLVSRYHDKNDIIDSLGKLYPNYIHFNKLLKYSDSGPIYLPYTELKQEYVKLISEGFCV
jgi:hypothetical protein